MSRYYNVMCGSVVDCIFVFLSCCPRKVQKQWQVLNKVFSLNGCIWFCHTNIWYWTNWTWKLTIKIIYLALYWSNNSSSLWWRKANKLSNFYCHIFNEILFVPFLFLNTSNLFSSLRKLSGNIKREEIQLQKFFPSQLFFTIYQISSL